MRVRRLHIFDYGIRICSHACSYACSHVCSHMCTHIHAPALSLLDCGDAHPDAPDEVHAHVHAHTHAHARMHMRTLTPQTR